jgi:hypothetical protein
MKLLPGFIMVTENHCDDGFTVATGITVYADLELRSDGQFYPVLRFERPGHRPLVIRFDDHLENPRKDVLRHFRKHALIHVFSSEDPTAAERYVGIWYGGQFMELTVFEQQLDPILPFHLDDYGTPPEADEESFAPVNVN